MNQTRFPTRPVLLVDNEQECLSSASLALNAEGINNIVQCTDSGKVMSALSATDFSVVLLDIQMPGLSGYDLLLMILADFPEVAVAVVTAVDSAESAVRCVKTGAYDYLVKSVDDTRLAALVRAGIGISDSHHGNPQFTDTSEKPEGFADIITQDRAMYSVFEYVKTIALTAFPVLITGETGVGKELIAAAVHELSGRTGKHVRINVAGLDDQLFSDALFGHRIGAFTSADSHRKGLIDQASNGTLFLDEIGDLHVESQVKLLRLLQESSYYALGDDSASISNARLVFATNREVEFLSNPETFRTDLYHRLKSYRIHLPPLRERLDDIPMLVVHFLDRAAKTMGKQTPAPPQELFDLLRTYSFPGNIRELEGMVTNAVSQHKGGALSTDSFRREIDEQSTEVHEDTILQARAIGVSALPILPDLKEALKETEQLFISEALKRADGNQTIAARLLGLSKNALHKRLSRSRTSSDNE